MSEETPEGSKGLFDSLKGLAASLITIVHTRIDLLSMDLEEERERLLSVLVLMLVALFCLSVGVLLLAILVAIAFWDSHRLLALGGLTGIFLAGGAVAFGVARYKLKTKPKLFAASLAELSKDRQQLGHPS
ncbi:phage holin family protein [Thiobacillus denitrificans]|uniref:phage holin family protein n=1 Tax=Thiobacillus denitrificans TaxID=36861 RepID=UPI00037AB766|nr:phage holin family protein [Thiobacillus denitrificans]